MYAQNAQRNLYLQLTWVLKPLTKKGYKRTNARFLDVLRGLRDLLPMWSLKLCQYEHVGIELGMVTEKAGAQVDTLC